MFYFVNERIKQVKPFFREGFFQDIYILPKLNRYQ